MPAVIMSNLSQVLIINGERVTGLAEDDPPVEMPEIELYSEKFGQDGTMYVMTTSRRGGEVVVKLAPSSPFVKKWLGLHARILSGERIPISGEYGDPGLKFSSLLRNGVMKQSPSGVSPGKTAEFTFVFEEIIPNYDNAAFGNPNFPPAAQ